MQVQPLDILYRNSTKSTLVSATRTLCGEEVVAAIKLVASQLLARGFSQGQSIGVADKRDLATVVTSLAAIVAGLRLIVVPAGAEHEIDRVAPSDRPDTFLDDDMLASFWPESDVSSGGEWAVIEGSREVFITFCRDPSNTLLPMSFTWDAMCECLSAEDYEASAYVDLFAAMCGCLRGETVDCRPLIQSQLSDSGEQRYHLTDFGATAKTFSTSMSSAAEKKLSLGREDLAKAYVNGGELVFPENGPTTVTEAICRAAESERGILVVGNDGNESFSSYSEIFRLALKMKTGLELLGVRERDSVILQCNDIKDHFVAFWACILGGFIPVTVAVPPVYKAENAVVSKLINVWEVLEHPTIICNEKNAAAIRGLTHLTSAASLSVVTAEVLVEHPASETVFQPKPEDVAFCQLSSGSTGTPKCIQIKHQGVIAHCESARQMCGYLDEDTWLNWLPLDHVGAILMWHLQCVYLRTAFIQVATERVLSQPLEWLRLMSEKRVNHTWSPNFGYQIVVDALAKQSLVPSYDLRCIRSLLNAGEQVQYETALKFIRALEPFGLREQAMLPAYGMAETCTAITYDVAFRLDAALHHFLLDEKSRIQAVVAPSSPGAVSFVNTGALIRGVEIRVVNDLQQVVSEQCVGQLQIRGPVITRGYWHNEEANSEAFVGDGWFSSGDLAFIYQQQLYITGREKEIIVVRGANIYCYEVEAIVGDIEPVETSYVGVFPVYNERTATEGFGVAYVGRSDTATLRQIRKVLTQRLGISPDVIIPLSKANFPKTTSGKIQRSAIAKNLVTGAYRSELRALDIAQANESTLPAWFYRGQWKGLPQPVAQAQPLSAQLCVIATDHATPLTGELSRAVQLNSSNLEAALPRLLERLIASAAPTLQVVDVHHPGADSLAHLLSAMHILNQPQWRSIALDWLAVFPGVARTAVTAERGLLRSFAQERARTHVRLLDVDDQDNWPAAVNAEITATGSGPADLRYRAGQRQGYLLERVEFLTSHDPLPDRELAIVFGGAGGIGSALSELLLEQKIRELVIVGKRDEAQAAAALAPLRALASEAGASVIYMPWDLLADADILPALTAVSPAWQTRLSVLIHCVGHYHERLLDDERPATLEGQNRVKLACSDVIERILEELPTADGVDVIYAGSILGLTGAMQAGGYCYGNGYLEGIPESAVGARRYVLAFGGWAETGINQNTVAAALLRRKGVYQFDRSQGKASVAAILGRCEPGVYYLGVDGLKRDIVPYLAQTSQVALLRKAADFPPLDGALGRYVSGHDEYPLAALIDLPGPHSLRWGSAGEAQQLVIHTDSRQLSLGLLAHPGSQGEPVLADGFARFVGRTLNLRALAALISERAGGADCALAVRWDKDNSPQLTACIAAEKTPSAEAAVTSVLAAMAGWLEMVFVARIPRNANGELDQKALQTVSAPVLKAPDQPASKPAGDLTASLAGIWADTLDISASAVNTEDNFFELGGNSLLIIQLAERIRQAFAVSIEVASLFETESLQQMTELVASLRGDATAPVAAVPSPDLGGQAPSEARATIAIIGVAGSYPKARDIYRLWKNIAAGVDCIGEVPADRWNLNDHFVANREDAVARGISYSKWGGFIDHLYEFDPLFFSISPREAELMNPKDRLFLQMAWNLFEDAGYAPGQLADERVGSFVGVSKAGYDLYGGPMAFTANRVAHHFNLHGPSMTIDTACSSSLVAIHEACLHIATGRCDMAIAGGIHAFLHPSHFAFLSAGGFTSEQGQIHPFGKDASGMVPAEGGGAVLLKPLARAQRDNDNIYAVIRGTAMNHGGKTNGFTVPNPSAHKRLVLAALADAQVTPEQISYVEAHGTGTVLGDPIEIRGLSMAFAEHTARTQFCRIGSLKSNIGHLEAAAGIAGLSKVLLQMRHRKLVPSLHARQQNPHIDFAHSPFVVQQQMEDWQPTGARGEAQARIAAISSFGAGGTNAHLIVEEYAASRAASLPPTTSPCIIVLSAKTQDQLLQRASQLLEFISDDDFALNVASDLVHSQPASSLDKVLLARLAYTLQLGREHMTYRLAIVASSLAELAGRLAQITPAQPLPDRVYMGEVGRDNATVSLFAEDEELEVAIARWVANGKYARILNLWVQGLAFDWQCLYPAGTPGRVSLPGYPFAREHYRLNLLSNGALVESHGQPASLAAKSLHPLVQTNCSTLYQQRFTSHFTGSEHFLADHQLRLDDGEVHSVLPGVAYLEMARAAIAQSAPQDIASSVLVLQDLVWQHPFVVPACQDLDITLDVCADDGSVPFVISSQAGETTHCQGSACFVDASAAPIIPIDQLRANFTGEQIDASSVYAAFAQMGLHFGPAHQALNTVYRGRQEVLAEIRLPAVCTGDDGWELHPSLLDAALQAAVGLLDNLFELARPMVPFAMESLTLFAPLSDELLVWVRCPDGFNPAKSSTQLDFDLLDRDGRVCAQIRGFNFRLYAGSASTDGLVMAAPVWQTAAIAPSPVDLQQVEHHVLTLGFADQHAVLARQAFQFHALPEAADDKAASYAAVAAACFQCIQQVLATRPSRPVFVQLLIPALPEYDVYSGLSGLLKTAQVENPAFTGQLLFVSLPQTDNHLLELVQKNASQPQQRIVRELGEIREIRLWQPWESNPSASRQFAELLKDAGVYLLTGGLGGLGQLMVKAILSVNPNAVLVLTGRSPLDAERQETLQRLADLGAVHYVQTDIAQLAQVESLVAQILSAHGQLNGVIHSAGVIRDGYLVHKTVDEFHAVLAPKVAGAMNLDYATRQCSLDFVVLFSSIAAVLGNNGQADYAAANGFLDGFAGWRNGRVTLGERSGRTLSINWPLWQDGGMTIDHAARKLLSEVIGMEPMPTSRGLDVFSQALAGDCAQVLAIAGRVAQIRHTLFTQSPPPAWAAQRPLPGTPACDPEGLPLTAQTRDYLRRQFAQLFKLPAQKIDVRAPLEIYGIDSVLAMALTTQLEKTFGPLAKTLFFEYQTIAELSDYFVRAHGTTLSELFQRTKTAPSTVSLVRGPESHAEDSRQLRSRFGGKPAVARAGRRQAIAIVGLSGRYPQSPDLDAFWQNLEQGRDCITEVPASRWDWHTYYSPQREEKGRHFSKWGGFIDGVDEFDPVFFNISPREAIHLDPQERLFLQYAWMAIEDAGYTRQRLQIPDERDLPAQVGVYVGVMYNEYQLYGAQASALGEPTGFAPCLSSIANRVSYVLNLHGPSMAVDTMCSSSLTAIHLACQDLQQGRTQLAIAGGVNVSIHANKYLVLSANQSISSDGHCQSFGEGGDGYIPGEGVGALVLQRLEDAEREGNHVYGLVRGTALSHGGKTNGFTVPSPQGQASAINRALWDAGLSADDISYIEAHGTGTRLGDPIEIAGLSRVFSAESADRCAIGSAKSNIGHCESAAGIAGVTKVLLQLKHRKIVPSLHSEKLNPNIDFANSRFYVNQTLQDWLTPERNGRHLPRIAGISSFGAGGANAHVIIEEYATAAPISEQGQVVMIPLSARTDAQLKAKMRDLRAFITQRMADNTPLNLASLAYTLQIGREPMGERVGLLVSTSAELQSRLDALLNGETPADSYRGTLRDSDIHALFDDADMQFTIDRWLEHRRLGKLLELWVRGLDFDWTRLYSEHKPPLMSLPCYPFARDRYWLELPPQVRAPTTVPAANTGVAAQVHPLLQQNISSLGELAFSSLFTGIEPFLSAEGVLPNLVSLNMLWAAYAAVARAGRQPLEIRGLAWGQPWRVGQGKLTLVLEAKDGEALDVDLFSAERVHCQAVLAPLAAPSTAARWSVVKSSEPVIAGDHVQLPLELPADTTWQFAVPVALATAILAAAQLAASQAQSPGSLVPLRLAGAQLVKPVAGRVWLLASLPRVTEGGVLSLDLEVVDASDALCVRLTGLALAPTAIAANVAPMVGGPAPTMAPLEVGLTLHSLAAKPSAIALRDPAQLAEWVVPQRQGGQHSLISLSTAAPVVAVQPSVAVPPAISVAPSSTGQAFDVIAFLRRSLAEALYLEEADVDPEQTFSDLGLDSIIGVEWVKEINRTLGLGLSATRIYDYTTIRELAGFLETEGEFNTPLAQQPAMQAPELALAGGTETVAAAGLSLSELEEALRQSLADALYLDVAEVDPTQTFQDLGLDSILGVEWVRTINKRYQVALSATRLYDYATVADLAGYLLPQLTPASDTPAEAFATQPVVVQRGSAPSDGQAIVEQLRASLAEALYLAEDELDIDRNFQDLGLDSILGVEWVRAINAHFGVSLSATRLYDYTTVTALAGYLAPQVSPGQPSAAEQAATAGAAPASAFIYPILTRRTGGNRARHGRVEAAPADAGAVATDHALSPSATAALKPVDDNGKIAIVGMSGRYPGAGDLRQFWYNLAQGHNAISEIPATRWDLATYYAPTRNQPGKMYSKWLGVLADVDCFDPLFFQISPLEAETMDPQHRLFLQEAYHAFEDAGYTPARLNGSRCGVYMGIMSGEYFYLQSKLASPVIDATGNSYAIGAARIAYHLNLKGPALSVDTACSSSLVSLHLACQALRNREIDLALAGGVTVYLNPETYVGMCQAGMLSPEGQCKAFDNSANGFVPGEGVGVLVVKRLTDAEADNDRIHGVILGSGINQDGKTSGITAPSVNSQIALLQEVYQRNGIDPASVSYVETHGTGTKLGDPIELEALAEVFDGAGVAAESCALASLKSNIGHTSAAAGVASVHKVLLQMQHQTLAPSLHFDTPNSHFDFSGSPFFVNTRLRPWAVAGPGKRRAGVSSFGFSGTNAHVVLEEYAPAPTVHGPTVHGPTDAYLIPLSARNPVRLAAQAEQLLAFLQAQPQTPLAALAATLQLGREMMTARLAMVVQSTSELIDTLTAFVAGDADIANAQSGDSKAPKTGRYSPHEPLVEPEADLAAVMAAWVKGAEVNWLAFWGARRPAPISLPGYPFARESYWLALANQQAPIASLFLHPLVHSNTSTLEQQSYTSRFTGQEFFLADHQVATASGQRQKLLPATAYLEMARAAMALATPAERGAVLELRDNTWSQPLVVDAPAEVATLLLPDAESAVRYEIYSQGGSCLHSQGRMCCQPRSEPETLDLAALRSSQWIEGEQFYAALEAMGLHYGSAHRTVTRLEIGDRGVLAELKLAPGQVPDAGRYILHPALLDGCLQASAGLLGDISQLPPTPLLPVALSVVTVFAPCQPVMYAWLRNSVEGPDAQGAPRFDIDVCDAQGAVCVALRGFATRRSGRAAPAPAARLQTLVPRWRTVSDLGQAAVEVSTECLVLGDSAVVPWLRQAGTQVRVAELTADASAADIARILASQSLDNLVWAAPADAPFAEQMAAAQTHGVVALFRIVKALLQLGLGSKTLYWTVLTWNSQAVGRDAPNPTHSAIAGFVGSLAKEYPNWHLRLLDLPGVDQVSAADCLRLPWSEQGDVCAYRHGEWLRQQLAPVAEVSEEQTLYRQGGVYVVIGGAGGLGEVWSRYMIEQYQAQIVWLGRSQPTDDITAKLHDLAERGPGPVYVQADATDVEALRTAAASVVARFGRIHGVVHSAIVLQDQSLALMDETKLRASLSAKVDISVNMAQVFADQPLDFLLFFSSLQSFSKAAGQANYAAGCTFKDTFASYLQHTCSFPVKTVNWGFWGSVGIVRDSFYQERMAKLGVGSIEPTEGMAALATLMGSPVPQLGVVKLFADRALAGITTAETVAVYPHTDHGLSAETVARGIAVSDQQAGDEHNALANLQDLHNAIVVASLHGLGLLRGGDNTLSAIAQIKPIPAYYARWLEATIGHLRAVGALDAEGLPRTSLELEDLWQAWTERTGQLREQANLRAKLTLLETCLKALPDILQGRRRATDIMFPASSMSMVENIYKGNAVADYYNEVLAACVRNALADLEALGRRDVRILEIGAGTGGTTARLIDDLAGYRDSLKEYCYTDLSRAFLQHAETTFKPRLPALRPALFDASRPLAGQDVVPGSYDLVIATNVLHATANIRETLRNTKALLKRDGVLLANEISNWSLYTHLTFGLLEGWWLYADPAVRIPGSAGLAAATWQRLLTEEGFSNTAFPTRHAERMGQQVIVASSDGVVCQQIRSPSAEPALAPGMETAPVIAAAVRAPQTPVIDTATVRAAIRSALSEALKIDPAVISDEESFADYGVDSITGVNLVRSLNESLQLDLETTALFDFTTVSQLAAHITTLPPLAELPIPVAQTGAATAVGRAEVLAQVRKTVVSVLASALKIDSAVIRNDEPFADYGVDSITGVNLVRALNDKLAIELETTSLFDYSSVNALAEHITAVAGETLAVSLPVAPVMAVAPPERRLPLPAAPDTRRVAAAHDRQGIAIIGMSGRFPQAESLAEFWQHLREGHDLVTEVSRWRPEDSVSADYDAATHCSRGGFVDSLDLFDPLFFKISPLEARYMDPKQRLMLEEGWKALEDAGYAGRSMSEARCGTFLGAGSSDYVKLFSDEPPSQSFWGNAGSVVAARIAYFLNLHGPAIAVDTACSSSLVAIHLACQSLWQGETDMALAGGIFIKTTPEFYQDANRANMLSATGKCHTFDASADGFVPGEGVGVVVLKRVDEAQADGDNIHGVIIGSGLNQDGTTNGITAPSARSQERLERAVYDRFAIDPDSLQYVEAHGTGTRLGDPIEFNALCRAFSHYTQRRQFCAIGSVKTNIGHSAGAAGVAGVLKVLLALKHSEIPPSLHYSTANPAIDFASSPFFVNTKSHPWRSADGLRRAAVSSFGFSGTNAHLVIEEAPPQPVTPDLAPAYLFVLSARTAEQRQQQVTQLLALLRNESALALTDISHTLLVGRLHLSHRLTCIARNSADLLEQLERWQAGEAESRIYTAEIDESRVREQASLRNYANECIRQCRDRQRQGLSDSQYSEHLATIAELYIQGYQLAFDELFEPGTRRVSLPTYPFARERYWLDPVAPQTDVSRSLRHPLVQENTSDLFHLAWRSRFTGSEAFLRDHQVSLPDLGRARLLPAAAYIEMAMAAFARAWPTDTLPGLVLRDVQWRQPLVVDQPQTLAIGFYDESTDAEVYQFEIISDADSLHCRGLVTRLAGDPLPPVDIAAVSASLCAPTWSGDEVYRAFDAMGYHYGESHRLIQRLLRGDGQVLASLVLPDRLVTPAYLLHPGLLDSALQASIGLLASLDHLPGELSVPFSLESLLWYRPCPAEVLAWVRATGGGDGFQVLDIDLLDHDGNSVAEIRGFSYRRLGQAGADGGFDGDFYQNVLDQLLNSSLSADDAAELG